MAWTLRPFLVYQDGMRFARANYHGHVYYHGHVHNIVNLAIIVNTIPSNDHNPER